MNALTRQQPMQMVLRPQSFDQLVMFSNMAAKSQMVPKDFQGKPENVMLAVQMGSELGLAPMQALQNIAIVNGRPSVWGDALPGLCRQSGVCKDIKEWFEGEGDGLIAHCEARRVGAEPVRQSFSVADAKKAGLWGKQGPWSQYPRRMLQMRARGFALRDAFPDVLRGLISAEEATDIPKDTFVGTTIDMRPEASSAGQSIDDSIPDRVMDAAPRRTIKQFLDDLQAELTEALAQTDPRPAVDAILGRDAVKRAEDTFVNGAKERLESIIQTAIAQIAEVDDGSVAP